MSNKPSSNRDDRMKKLICLFSLATFLGVLASGCTSFPAYERTIIKVYDADMNLKEIHEIERISQQDPIDRTLHPELQKQTYSLPKK